MSMAKRLAAYYSRNEARADQMTALLKRFKLDAVAPRLKSHITGYAKRHDQYDTLYVYSADVMTDAEIANVKQTVGAPADVVMVVEQRADVLDGSEVYYRGTRWSTSAREKLNRFVTSK
jgi:hypothetical protein